MNQYFIYILANKRNGALYVGVTNNLKYRISQHKTEIFDGFTKRYHIKLLVYYEISNSIESAILREKQLKAGNRKKKLFLIESQNPEWKDLYDSL